MSLDIEPFREMFLPACRSHEIRDVENICDCRRKDPRWAIFELIAEVERLRIELDRARGGQ